MKEANGKNSIKKPAQSRLPANRPRRLDPIVRWSLSRRGGDVRKAGK